MEKREVCKKCGRLPIPELNAVLMTHKSHEKYTNLPIN
jgi:RNase P subunit RPR2